MPAPQTNGRDPVNEPHPTPGYEWLHALTDALGSSVRPGLAWAFALALIGLTAFGMRVPDALWGLGGAVITFFFTTRQIEKAEQRMAVQQKEMVEMAKSLPPPPV